MRKAKLPVSADWVRGGLVGKRTRLVETDLDIQRGLLAGFTYKMVSLTGYFFNPGSDDHFEVVALSMEF